MKAGTILPMGKLIQYSGEKPVDTLEIRIYTGTDAQFDLYEDEGDNYNYEAGKYTIIPFKWNEKHRILTICERLGSYTGYLTKRIFNIVFVNGSEELEDTRNALKKQVSYSGKEIEIKVK